MGFFSDAWDNLKDWVNGKIVEPVKGWWETNIGSLSGADTVEGMEEHEKFNQQLFEKELMKQAREEEKECMKVIDGLFSDIDQIIQNTYPDLAEHFKKEKEVTREKLEGIYFNYARERISPHAIEYAEISKLENRDTKVARFHEYKVKTLNEARDELLGKLSKCIDKIQRDFDNRLTERVKNQRKKYDDLMNTYQSVIKDANERAKVLNEKVPIMESASCIIRIVDAHIEE